MVEEETRRYRPTKNYLEHLPPLNLSAFEVCKLLYSDRYTAPRYNIASVFREGSHSSY